MSIAEFKNRYPGELVKVVGTGEVKFSPNQLVEVTKAFKSPAQLASLESGYELVDAGDSSNLISRVAKVVNAKEAYNSMIRDVHTFNPNISPKDVAADKIPELMQNMRFATTISNGKLVKIDGPLEFVDVLNLPSRTFYGPTLSNVIKEVQGVRAAGTTRAGTGFDWINRGKTDSAFTVSGGDGKTGRPLVGEQPPATGVGAGPLIKDVTSPDAIVSSTLKNVNVEQFAGPTSGTRYPGMTSAQLTLPPSPETFGFGGFVPTAAISKASGLPLISAGGIVSSILRPETITTPGVIASTFPSTVSIGLPQIGARARPTTIGGPVSTPMPTPFVSISPTITSIPVPTVTTPTVVPTPAPLFIPTPTPTVTPPVISPVVSPVVTPVPVPIVSPTVTVTPTSRTTLPGSPTPYPYPGLLLPPVPKEKKKEETKKKPFVVRGYKVEVRRRKKFRVESPFALSKEEAVKFGVTRTLGAAAATFRVVPTSESARALGIGAPSAGELQYFRAPKTKVPQALTFVQKERKRIVTPGEKREITYTGVRAAAMAKTTRTARKSRTTFKKPKGYSFSRIRKGGRQKWF